MSPSMRRRATLAAQPSPSRYSRWTHRLLLITALVIDGDPPAAAPSAPANWRQVVCLLCGAAGVADGLANLLLFIPPDSPWACGECRARYAAHRGGPVPVRRVAQFLIPGRDPSLSDLIFNTLGAGVGGPRPLAPRWVNLRRRVAARLSLSRGGRHQRGVDLDQRAAGALVAGHALFRRHRFAAIVQQAATARQQHRAATAPSEDGSTRSASIGGRGLAPRSGPNAHAAWMERRRISWPRTTSRRRRYGLTDVSGHRNHGLIRGATWTTQGRSGSALDFADAGPPSSFRTVLHWI